MLAQLLIAASAAIVLILGTVHLAYTYFSTKLHPRDPSIAEQMKRDALVISKRTTVWDTWIGFNASHSLGLMFFGATYGYLAIFQFQFLMGAKILLLLGAVFLFSIVAVAKRYYFMTPLVGVSIACVSYAIGVALALA